ncbi:hypothetical protein B0H13DRAFT_1922967 [Mycena leptocephala]|nr:hypothetical protein B0H13DRAFT_1922967 [Mycena leptocephala]
MSDSTLGCAQNAHGDLLDASKIQLFNDADDKHLIYGPASISTTSSSRPLASIFTQGKPARKVAGSRRPSRRRSSRTSRPSACVIDPNNVKASNGSSKRKSGPENASTVARKASRIYAGLWCRLLR